MLISIAIREVVLHSVELELGLRQLLHFFVIISKTDSGDAGGQSHTQVECLIEIDLHFNV